MRDPLRAVLTVARVVYLYQALGGTERGQGGGVAGGVQ